MSEQAVGTRYADILESKSKVKGRIKSTLSIEDRYPSFIGTRRPLQIKAFRRINISIRYLQV
jgi:hypothetical protein